MRFQPSQTTPMYLDRRLQLRMLSFVGLIAVIMFTLSAINHRPATRDASSQQAAVSPDSLTYEVLREERELKEGEFIIPDSEKSDSEESQENEPRGQSPRSSTAAGQDRDLFMTRNKERGHLDPEDEKLFSRRTPAAKNADGHRSNDSWKSVDLKNFDDGQTVNARPSKGLDRLPPATAPLVNDDWSTDSVGIDRQEPARRPPSGTKPSKPKSKPVDLEDDSREPFPSRADRNDGVTSSYRDSDLTDANHVRDLPPLGRRSRDKTDGFIAESDREIREGGSLQPPIDLRRRGNLPRTPGDSLRPYEKVATPYIDKSRLDVVKDNTVGIRRDESKEFYWLLDHARRVPPKDLERAGDREVQYINVMTEPERFRGEPITIEGDLWRLYEFDAGKNDYDVEKIYEGWVFTGDSGNHPYRIVCTSLPNGIEPGENLRKPVRITGYFFKREAYKSNGGIHFAPTLLARRIRINPMPNGIPQTAGILPYMIGAIMAVGLALLVTIVGFAIGDGRSSREGMRRWQRSPQISFAGLEIPATVSVEESLRQLAETERASAVSGAYGPLYSREAAREHAVHDYRTSHQLQLETSNRQHRQQTGALQNWSARQQAVQAEIDGLRGAQSRLNLDSGTVRDELSSDELDPAINVLVGPRKVEHPFAKPTIDVRSKATPAPFAPVTVPSEVTTSASRAVDSAAIIPPSARPTNISYGASKLSEWEDEIAKMSHLGAKTNVAKPPVVSPPESFTSRQIELDRKTHEEELHNRLQIERLDRERMEREQLIRESAESENLADERVSFDRADRDSTSFSLASPPATSSELPVIEDDLSIDDLVDETPPPSRWGKFQRRRKS